MCLEAMNLKEIYRQSSGILSHAERDVYIAYCAFADSDGFCFPNKKTIAEMTGILPQSFSRIYKKLLEFGFLKVVKTDVFCQAGFDKTKPEVKFSKPEVKFEENKTKPEVNKTKHSVKSTKPEVKSLIITNQLTNQLSKEKDISYEISKKKKKEIEFVSFPLPKADTEPELWNEFLEHRLKLKKPLTKRGYSNLLGDLAKLGDGFDLNRRIADALDYKWVGLVFKNDFIDGVKNNGTNQNSNSRMGYGKVSERDKSASRSANGHALFAELQRSGKAERDAAEQKLLGDSRRIGDEVT